MGVPYISGGTGITLGQYFTVVPGESPCKACFYKKHLEVNKELHEATSKLENNNAAILPHISMIASLICMEALRLILKTSEPISLGKRTLIDFITGQIIKEEEWEPICSFCSKERSLNRDIERQSTEAKRKQF